MRARHALLILITIGGIPLRTSACEPIFPITQLLAGSSVVGPALITRSLTWLLVAVAIKCLAFVFFERRLGWKTSVWFMLMANVVSTIPGLLIAVFVGSVGAFFLAIPLTAVLAFVVSRRWKRLTEAGAARFSTGTATLLFSAVFFGSIVLHEFAVGANAEQSYSTYWILKFVFVTLVACSGIVISAALEECVIARLARKTRGEVSFFTPVLRANYVTLGMVLLVSAVQMLPARLRAPHFIVGWLADLFSGQGFM